MAYLFSEIDVLDVIKGDTFSHDFEVEGFELLASATEIKAQVKKYYESPEVALEFKLSDGSIVRNGNFLNFRKSAALMNIEPASYKYDVQFMYNNGDVYTLFGGDFKVKKAIST